MSAADSWKRMIRVGASPLYGRRQHGMTEVAAFEGTGAVHNRDWGLDLL